jgi:POT family proton-dependent oligopeptide transporter
VERATATLEAVRPLPRSNEDVAFFGHPRGLSTLFFTEMWERFSYYGMRALLILYMTAPITSGGLGWSTAQAGPIYGLYTSMVYMMCLPGGWLADRLFGLRRAVLYGGILIALGHFSLAVPSIATFYLGLVLIVLGTGLLKPNISAIVGELYAPGDQRRDAGFSIYYMGINLGAFIAPLVCGYLGQNVNWHYGFGAAGVGMLLGVVQYVLGDKYLGEAGKHPAAAATPVAGARERRRTILIVSVFGAALVVLGLAAWQGILPVTASQIADWAGRMLMIVTVVFFAWLFFGGTWTTEERKRLYAIGAFFLAAALFWAGFEQAGSTLNLFGDRSTTNVAFGTPFPSSWYQSLNSLFIITFAPVFAWLWLRLGRREPSTPVKFALGLLGMGAGFAVLVVASQLAARGVQVSPMWLVVTYLLHTCGELCLSPVGLSAMTKLAPARIAGLMMGVWFLGSSVGNFIAGGMAAFYEAMPLPQLFGSVAAFGAACGIVMLLVSGPIRRLMGTVR